MALSGSIHTATWSDGRIKCSVVFNWTVTQNIENNTSTISWSLNSETLNANFVTISELRLKFADEIIYYRGPSEHTNGYNDTLLASGTKDIEHNHDGTKSFDVLIEAGIYNWAINKSGSGTIILDTIPRASSISSVSNITLGDNCSVKWTPASSEFKYKLIFSLENWSITVPSDGFIMPNTTDDYTYTEYIIPNDLALLEQIPSSTTGIMSVKISTYNSDDAQIGSTSAAKTFTVTVPSDIVPTVGTITLDPEDINNQNILVQGKNKITVSVSECSAGSGSAIKSYTFSGPGISYTGSSTSVTSSGKISDVGELIYTVTVTDNRGRSTSKTASIRCYEYAAPYFISFNAYRTDSDGEANINGSYIRCDYTTNYSDVNETNEITITAHYNSNEMISSEIPMIIDLNGDTSTMYKVYLEIRDSYGGISRTSEIIVFGEARVLNITSNGNGVAIGKMAEIPEGYSGIFECRWPAKFIDNIVCEKNIDTKNITCDKVSTTDVECKNLSIESEITSEKINCNDISINQQSIFDLIYPVGSIYMSVNNTSPQDLFGGKWESLKDRFLLGAGDIYSAGATGGEPSHLLTIDEMPEHVHEFTAVQRDTSLTTLADGSRGYVTGTQNTTSTGGGQAHNNMPPYLAVFMWKRVE